MKTKNKQFSETDVNTHYALRKISKQLLSVSVGLFFAGVVNEREMPQVKAASLPDNNQVSQVKSNQEVVAFGKIIPLDSNRQPIPNAPTPEYRRDPFDPNKAIATPAPKIKNYELAKDNQAENFDAETKMVIPPANPQENTEIIYLKQEIKPVVPPTRPSSPAQTRPAPVIKPNKPVSSTNGHTNYYQGNSAAGNGANWTGYSDYSTYAPNTAQNKNWGTNNVAATYAASADSSVENGVEAAKTTVEDKSTNKGNKKKSQKPKKEHKKAKVEPKKPTAKVKKKKKERPEKKSTKNKRPPQLLTQLPPVITNPETQVPPKPRSAILNFVDLDENERLVFQMKTEGVPGTLIDFKNFDRELLKRQAQGYELVDLIDTLHKKDLQIHQQYPFGLFGDDDIEFNLNLKHKLAAVNIHSLPNNLDPKLVKHTVSLVVRYTGAGAQTPKDIVQSAVWTRTLTWDCVTEKLVNNGKFNTSWLSYPLTYEPVPSPQITGLVADIEEVPRMPVTSEDIIKTVTYQTVEEVATLHDLVSEDNEIDQTKNLPEADETESETNAVSQEPVIEKDEAPVAEPATSEDAADEKPEAPSAEPTVTNLQVRHFVNEDGMELYPPQQIEPDSDWPVITGYYLVSKAETQTGITATYKRLGRIVPVDLSGNLIAEDQHYVFKNDPVDAESALSNQAVPEIKGWKPTTLEITPDNPNIDIPVVYQKD